MLPAGGIGGIGLKRGQTLPHQGGEGLGLPAHHRELMAQLEQEGNELPTHESRAPQQQQTHASNSPQ